MRLKIKSLISIFNFYTFWHAFMLVNGMDLFMHHSFIGTGVFFCDPFICWFEDAINRALLVDPPTDANTCNLKFSVNYY